MKVIQFLLPLTAVFGVMCFTGCGSASAETASAALCTADEPLVATSVAETAVRANTWETDADGHHRYYDENGEPVTGVVHIDNHVYRFRDNGVQFTGWQTVEGKRYYYEPLTGNQPSGWVLYQDAWYYVTLDGGKQTGKFTPVSTCTGKFCDADDFVLTDSYGALLTGHFQYTDGCWYYADEAGLIQTGDVQLNDGWYRFHADGVQAVGWQEINGRRYYFNPETGKKAIGLTEIDGSLYDFAEDGSMQTGWQTVNKEQYYFSPTDGTAYTGWLTLENHTYFLHTETRTAVSGQWDIDGVPYYFDSGYCLMKNDYILLDGIEYYADANGVLSEVIQDETGTLINGVSRATAAQMTAYIKSVNPNVAQSVLDMIPYYLSEGEKEGIRGDIAFAQSCLETGNFTFCGSAVTLDQNNFCGLGVTMNGMKGNSFDTPQLGIRAQIQHLKAYSCTESLAQAQIDPRFGYVLRGCAPYVEWLGIQENPQGKGWAAGAGYGDSILRILNHILSMPWA